ncbi:hypothetical protein Forpe1208_v000120 [Fusarium oxysporum f. sp. rapae]|uniref:Uncharacterized protein n=1 Tax=Fusarium oxysporum f. sp. rapae TaxID=485398 RepID=A0A8J5PDR5_FUSOX|nr:hypothetical protein Forpe1208_v000120 [Fusarium oxysporum f. sp. rapae]
MNFVQTWVKRLGHTKKSNILAKRSLSIADLEGPFLVQVSFCTGIARRVRLRELLADVLPAYVADLATTPRYWERLQGCDILEILRDDNFRTHYQKLDRELQAEFETLAIAVLFLLQDTGVDREGGNFVVGCISPGLAVQCFKIPIEKESFWARILADSEDVATFAYVAMRCFETDLVRCRGPTEPWLNSTALFSTAVSLSRSPSHAGNNSTANNLDSEGFRGVSYRASRITITCSSPSSKFPRRTRIGGFDEHNYSSVFEKVEQEARIQKAVEVARDQSYRSPASDG